MRHAIAAVVAAAALLAGCSPLFFGKVEEPSLAVTQRLPPVPGAPPVVVPSGLLFPAFTFEIGDVGVKQDSSDSTLWLNGATLAMVSPGPLTSFSDVTTAALAVVPPAGSALPEVVVADFDAARDGAAGTTLALKGTGRANLLPYLQATRIALRASMSGALPGPADITWTADLTLDFHVVAQKNLP